MDTDNKPQVDNNENMNFQDIEIQKATQQEVKQRSKALIGALIIVLLLLAGFAVAGFLFIKQGPDTVQGQADATEVRISGTMPGRVEELYVKEGQYVHAGDTLVRIHSELVDAKLAQAQAAEQAAAATSRTVDAGARPQTIESAHDIYKQAQAASSITKKTYDRMNSLADQGVVSQQKRDEAKAAYDAAVAAEAAAKSQWELAKAGARDSEKAAANAMVNVAKGGIKEVNAVLKDRYLIAPCDGEVTIIYPHVSELIAMGAPVMTIQTDDHWAVFNVRENLLKDIKLGSKIKVKIPALDKETEMEVFYIRDMGSYANWQATKSTGDYDARTFTVKARSKKHIDNFRPGMSVILVQ